MLYAGTFISISSHKRPNNNFPLQRAIWSETFILHQQIITCWYTYNLQRDLIRSIVADTFKDFNHVSYIIDSEIFPKVEIFNITNTSLSIISETNQTTITLCGLIVLIFDTKLGYLLTWAISYIKRRFYNNFLKNKAK